MNHYSLSNPFDNSPWKMHQIRSRLQQDLYRSVKAGDIDAVYEFIKFAKGFLFCTTENRVLSIAIEQDNIKMLVLLLTLGINPDAIDGTRRTPPLYHAFIKGRVECMRWLLIYEANPNIKYSAFFIRLDTGLSIREESLLHHLAHSRSQNFDTEQDACIRLLHIWDADFTQQDSEERTPGDIDPRIPAILKKTESEYEEIQKTTHPALSNLAQVKAWLRLPDTNTQDSCLELLNPQSETCKLFKDTIGLPQEIIDTFPNLLAGPSDAVLRSLGLDILLDSPEADKSLVEETPTLNRRLAQ